ncbi:unnamed protein product [Enterobius vermicularis]|uniref:Cytokine receptor-like factor 3 n=1 Tax=Enterobius vermicularis TaxID=51028 RepID=A0A158QBC8_ENTVE|nr:unnamed protein product [Enterobius vermicularis]
MKTRTVESKYEGDTQLRRVWKALAGSDSGDRVCQGGVTVEILAEFERTLQASLQCARKGFIRQCIRRPKCKNKIKERAHLQKLLHRIRLEVTGKRERRRPNKSERSNISALRLGLGSRCCTAKLIRSAVESKMRVKILNNRIELRKDDTNTRTLRLRFAAQPSLKPLILKDNEIDKSPLQDKIVKFWTPIVGDKKETYPKESEEYVPSEDNPADMGSRGCTPNELKNNDLWWSGSDWLTEPFSKWPLDIQLDMQQSSVKLEENKEEKSTVSSNYKVRKQLCDDIMLSTDAETILVKQTQIKIDNNKIQKWNLHRDSNKLYRVHVRLGNASYWKPSLYLPNDDRLTYLLILKCYEQNMHAGVSHTLSLDYMGPTNVDNSTYRKVMVSKVWIALFTCFTTRAIHSELADDLKTNGDENYIINTLGSAPGCQPQEEQCVTKENTLT